MCACSRSSPASACSTWAWSGPASARLGSARSSPTGRPCCGSTGQAFRCGAMCGRWRGMKSGGAVAQLTLWQVASPANPTPSRGSGVAKKMSAICGPNFHGWCERFDRAGCWLRTFLASALQQRTMCSLTWKHSATPAGRSWWVLTTLARPTVESASGSWATPRVAVLSGVATPMSCPSHGWDLPAQVQHVVNGLWASPQARDWKDSGPTQGNRKSPNIGTQAIRLSCEAGPPDPESSSTSGRPRDWPTARAERYGAPDSHGKAPIRGALSPAWVAQLMGAPDGWLEGVDAPPAAKSPAIARPRSEHSATASSRKSSRKSAGRFSPSKKESSR